MNQLIQVEKFMNQFKKSVQRYIKKHNAAVCS